MPARFFCDNCGATVDRKTDRCPQCGCFFENVRCPKCGFTGEENLFSKGCPSCGYFAENSAKGKKKKKAAIAPKAGSAAMPPLANLPLWVYVVALLGLLLVTLLMVFTLR